MIAINKNSVLFSFFIWIMAIQAIFYFQQENSGNKILGTIESQLRDELNTSNYLQLSKNLTDYTYLKFIKCAKLEKNGSTKSTIIDLSYMATDCQSSYIYLNGYNFQKTFNSLNGDSYSIQFISLNSRSFFIALWLSRLIGCLIIALIYWIYILEQKNKKLINENKIRTLEEIRSISLQVAHDIRSPLAVINTTKDNLSNKQSYHIFENAIKRINEISNDLLDYNKSIKKIHTNINLSDFIFDFIIQKNIEKECSIKFENNNLKIFSNINPTELSRILSNLLNNSIEATEVNNREIKVKLEFKHEEAIITIIDNGKGISKETLKDLGKIEKSSKVYLQNSGSGIGLLSAFKYINSIKGKITIKSEENKGTQIDIHIPAINGEDTKFILIDDDQLTQLNWDIKAKKSRINIEIFNSFDNFIEKLNQINKSDIIYIDNELGNIKGEDIALDLYERGFKNLYLTTGHPPEKFQNLTFLKGVIGKAPPF